MNEKEENQIMTQCMQCMQLLEMLAQTGAVYICHDRGSLIIVHIELYCLTAI
jgi:hypothetical protein